MSLKSTGGIKQDENPPVEGDFHINRSYYKRMRNRYREGVLS